MSGQNVTEPAGKTPLLFLCHRIPYPPNKGDKIRSFHLLHHLERHFDIYLATFVDDPADWPWVPEVEKFCRDSLFLEQDRWRPRLRSLRGLLSGEALSIPYYDSEPMRDWVRRKVRDHGIRHAMVFSSSMAQFALQEGLEFERKVVDYVDVDSDKWRQYAERQRWPMSWLYRRESTKLLSYEERLAQQFDAGLFVSHSEAQLFRELVPDCADKVGYYNNGVNTEYFHRSDALSNPYPRGVRPVVFTGAMDYWPNVDAVQWFAEEVLPALRRVRDDVYFYIVGSNPSRQVQQLANEPGVVVTGRVDDVRPYLQFADAAVAPMRVARGVQNKVLEALAMACPVLVSRKGLEGINAEHADQLLLADSAAEYVDQLQRVLAGEHPGMAERGKNFVREHFNWDNNLPEVVLLLGSEPDPGPEQRVASNG